MTIKPYPPADRGYYFLMHKNDIKIVRYTLIDNGFKDIKETNKNDWSIYWQTGAIKK